MRRLVKMGMLDGKRGFAIAVQWMERRRGHWQWRQHGWRFGGKQGLSGE